ncbi:MAG: spore coat protein CotH [Aureispira sp.]|nr:spore coat protein CotH [Aureispira sp.]
MKALAISIFLCCWTWVNLYAQEGDTVILKASPEAGFISKPTAVKLSTNIQEANIFYTTDGNPPSSASKRYRKPIIVDSTMVIQAVAYYEGNRSVVNVNTYLLNEDTTHLPIVSIAIRPEIILDPIKGLFFAGPRASKRFPHKGANYYSKKEHRTHVEFFEPTKKERVYKGFLGFRIFGGMSRIFPQKSIGLYARKSRYKTKRINYKIFKDKDIKKFKRIVLRNSGSDFGETHFRDAFITSLGREMGLETQAYQPSIVFINGKYWGVYNLREKLTRHYLTDNFGYHKDSVDLIEHRKSVQAGSRRHYDRMRMYMRNNNLAVQEHYDSVGRMMDIENFMEYEILQIFIDNQDAGGNIKFWRPQIPGGKWRWILFDTDFGYGHYGRYGYKFNSLAFHTKPDGPIWPNPPWSTLNLRSLLQNKGFRDAFVSRFADRMNSTFDSTYVIKRIEKMADNIRPAMPRHWERWKKFKGMGEKRWTKEVDRMKEFARKRAGFMRQFLRDMFPKIGDEIRLNVGVRGVGEVKLNDVISIKDTFSGIYFQNLPVEVFARPSFGTLFSHWELDGERINDRYQNIRFSDTLHTLIAVFEKGEHPKANQIIINEISFRDTSAGHWVEFFNNSDEAIDLEGWKLMNKDGKEFIFPDVTLQADSFLVVCRKKKRFEKAFPACRNFIGGLFKFSKHKDDVLLYAPDGDPVDSIGYRLEKEEGDALLTLALKDFNNDNSNIDNWKIEDMEGSPASVNPDYIKLKKARQFNAFMRYIKIGGVTVGIFVTIIMAYVLVKRKLKKID